MDKDDTFIQPSQTTAPSVASLIADRLNATRSTLLWTGIAFSVLGLGAICFPVASSVVTNATIGWILMFSGVVSLFASFSFRGAGPFFGALLTSLLTIAAGVFMLRNPETALKILTLFVAVVFLIDGAFTAGTAFELKPIKGWGWMLVSAISSCVVGIMIISGLPETSLVVLGILVGIRFLSGGLSSIMVSRILPKVS